MQEERIYQTGETDSSLKREYNPEGSQMRNVQMRLLDMLLYFRDICEKLGISYYIDGGTLLGAVRHGGFVPWDDDLDVVIDVRDMRKLQDYFLANPHPVYFFQSQDTEKDYFKGWPKIVDLYSSSTYNGNSQDAINQQILLAHTGVSMDVFPYSDHVISGVNKIIHRLHKLNMRHILNKSKGAAICIDWILFKCCKPVANFMGKLFCDKKTIAHDYLSVNTVHRFIKDKVYPLSKITFEGYEFSAPKDPDYYLKTLYGNYMFLPPEKERHHHDLDFTLLPCEVK